jgi:hypothetical protein
VIATVKGRSTEIVDDDDDDDDDDGDRRAEVKEAARAYPAVTHSHRKRRGTRRCGAEQSNTIAHV